MKLFKIFKYLSFVYTGDLNAVFGDCNGDYSRQKRWQTVAVSATIVAVPDDYSQSPFRATKSPKTETNCRRFGRLQSPFSATTIGKNYSIRFEISNNKLTIRFDSKWKTTIRTALFQSNPTYMATLSQCYRKTEKKTDT